MHILDSFESNLMKVAADGTAPRFPKLRAFGARAARAVPIAAGLTGIATGVTGLVLASKARKERKALAGATGRAVRILGREAATARGQRNQIANALVSNTKADVISRRALGNAMRRNYAQDAMRGEMLATAVRKNYELDRKRTRALIKLHKFEGMKKQKKA
jgi:hypothetical protein